MIVSQRLIADVSSVKCRNYCTLDSEGPYDIEITCLLPDCDLLKVRDCVHWSFLSLAPHKVPSI